MPSIATPSEKRVADLGWSDSTGGGNWTKETFSPLYKSFLGDSWEGTLTRALGAGGLFALAYKLLRGRKATWRGMLTSGMLGAFTAGPGYSTWKTLQGPAYNRTYDTSKIKPGDTVYIGVSGAGDGPGSELDRALHNKLGAGHYAMFRHNDMKGLEEFLTRLPKGVNPVIWSHSWGGSQVQRNAGKFNKMHNNIEYHTIDPVGWTGWLTGQRGYGTVYTPSTRKWSDDSSNALSFIGGQWRNPQFASQKEYTGGHSKGVQELVESKLK